MGIPILELVLQRLRLENIPADVAYPGQKYPTITAPVAAVHVEKVDRPNLTVTLEVNIVSPAALGGTRCEAEALRAVEILRQAGAACIQNGCRYDSLSRVYVVQILAAFTCDTGEATCTLGPGFRVSLDGTELPCVLRFQAEQSHGLAAQYEMGADAPIGIRSGAWHWSIQLEELIPPGSPEVSSQDAPFTLRLESDTATEVYCSCRWTRIRREFTREGLRKICSGISLEKKEVISG